MSDTPSASPGTLEVQWLVLENQRLRASVRDLEAEREQATRELAGVRVTFTAMEELRMQTRDALVGQNAKVERLEAALQAARGEGA